MKTADQVRNLGLYTSACCAEELLFDVNDVLTRCPKCERLCSWQLVEEVLSWQQLEDMLESQAA